MKEDLNTGGCVAGIQYSFSSDSNDAELFSDSKSHLAEKLLQRLGRDRCSKSAGIRISFFLGSTFLPTAK